MPSPIARTINGADYERFLQLMLRRLSAEERRGFEELPLQGHVWRWLCWLKAAGRADTTLCNYAGDAWEFIEWLRTSVDGSIAASELRPSHLQDYQSHLGSRGLGQATICRKLDALSGFFKYLVRAGVMDSNPLDSVPRSRPDTRRDIWVTREDADKLLAATDGPLETAALMTYYLAGLRPGELPRLHLRDVDMDNRVITVRNSKGGSTRHVPFSSHLAAYLEAYLDTRTNCDRDEFFVTSHGTPPCRRTLDRWFHKWVRAAGLTDRGYTRHCLRHGCATNWLDDGLTIYEVSQLLGHRSIETTARYLHYRLKDTQAKIERNESEQREEPDPGPASTSDHRQCPDQGEGNHQTQSGDIARHLRIAMAQAVSSGDLQLAEKLLRALEDLAESKPGATEESGE